MTKAEVLELVKGWDDDDHFCLKIFSTEDVLNRAEELDIPMEEWKANEILDRMHWKVEPDWTELDMYIKD